ncbi:tryptophan halogenase family protein [Porticoccus sp. GXU_MW_L64]
MDKKIKSVVVVGGGTAGWITAGRIAAEHRVANSDSQISVTLVESPTTKIIGVGEGTWPTMRATLSKMGISETDFIRQCNATFKQGAKFARWVNGDKEDFYYHPLMLPQGFSKIDLASYWHSDGQYGHESFSNAVCFQEQLCEQGLAPKMITTPEYGSIANYAYHLDAGKFATFLHDHCTKVLGVQHILADVTAVKSTPDGDIASLTTTEAGDIEGDLFVDCTGFRSLLLGEHYNIPFVDHSDVLFIDTALAVQVPYQSEDDDIACHTISTGQSAGWIWDIGLSNRRGIGHVYSSRYNSEDNARQELASYVGDGFDADAVRKIPIKSGHRELFWHRNCVAVGLSAGFLEPLEASAIVLVELSAAMIAEQLPARRSVMDIVARRFNDTFLYRWGRIIDFLKLHYILSQRTEPFWVDNRREDTIPDSLKELMEVWKYQTPGDRDFTSNNEVFPAASYQYVLYGMGFKPDADYSRYRLDETENAADQFAKNREIIGKTTAALPRHRELISKIHQYGLQRI